MPDSRKKKIAPRKGKTPPASPPDASGGESLILVGTYRPKQLEKWVLPRGLYNYPVKDTDAAILAAAPNVGELWLYQGKADRRRFAAKLERTVTAAELDSMGYPQGMGEHHGEKYLLFRVREISHRDTETQREGACPHAPSGRDAPTARPQSRILIRLDDFEHDEKLRARLKRRFFGKTPRKPVTEADRDKFLYWLPDDLRDGGCGALRVCEAAEQLSFDDFLGKSFVGRITHMGNSAKNLQQAVDLADGALRCIDLFSGAGGLSEGLSEAGFHSLFAAEIVPTYAKTYEFNHRDAQVTTADIRTLDADEIRRQLGIERGDLDLIAGGPPCQGFSINAPVRSILDKRNHLFKEYLRFVDAFQPRCVLIENVPGLVSFEDGKTLHAILDALAGLGYGADVRILGAAYYGVPQMRWRTIIIGTRGKELPSEAFPDPICHAPIEPNFTSTFDGHSLLKIPSAEKSSKFTTVKDAIGDLPPLVNGERGVPVKGYAMPPQCDYQRRSRRGSTGVHNHEAPRLSAINVERMSFIRPGGNWTDIPDELLPKGMKNARKSDHTKRYGRVRPDGLASTILTKCDPHWGAYIHYDQDRSFTVREAARIQSFPDHYVFLGSMAEQFAQVGNAVPPMLARAIGISIKSILKEEV